MNLKDKKGFSGVDIVLAVLITTIFVTIIGSLIININSSKTNADRKTIATSYAIDEIEKIKANGYVKDYENKGLDDEEVLLDEDILDKNGKFTGYHKKVFIKDFVLRDFSKKPNYVKDITVNITYKYQNKNQEVNLSTYISKY